jgi:Fe-S cluster assembly ATP-binding protein
MTPLFEVRNLHAKAGSTPILRGVDLTIAPGEIHALLGPNGSGKSTLANVLLGNPEYEMTEGSILFKGDDITTWPADVRGKSGMFLAFQYPQEIAGVSVINFLRKRSRPARASICRCSSCGCRSWSGCNASAWTRRSPTATSTKGFSGGEKKAQRGACNSPSSSPSWRSSTKPIRASTSTRCASWPRVSTKYTATAPRWACSRSRTISACSKSWYPTVVHIMIDGRIVATGGLELVERLERDGYESWR